MTFTFWEMIGYCLSSIWNVIVALFNGVIALITIVGNIIVNLVIMIINLFGFIPWLIPACLLPLFYCSLVVLAIKFFVEMSNKKGGA